jgi:ArsR family transcriptional regulator
MTDTAVLLPARAAAVFHALSDETRLEILSCLSGCERCVCDMAGALDAAQSRLSFHLKVLKDAGLITDRRSGRWVYYTIVPEAMAEAAAFLSDVQKGGVCQPSDVACCG